MVSKDFDLTKLNTFPKLLDYLRIELDWPIEDQNLDDLTFEYAPEELGVTEEHQININSIQQLRPLSNNQPWGIFFIDFESKKLPIVLLRRLLSALVPKNRASSQSSSQPTWNLDDLLFVSLLGEEKNRQICFSHFKEVEKGLPVLQTFSWDETETHLYYLKKFNLGSLRWPSNVNNSDEWKSNWSSAFTASHGQVIKNSKELSVELAKIAKSIRNTVNEIYKYETDNGHYHKLLVMFKEALIHNLKSDDFSDMVAQTVTYGLFSAATTGGKLTGLSNLSDLIPNTNPFLKSLFDELTTISITKQKVNFDELGLNDLFNLLNETNMDAIMQQFGRQTAGGIEDPVIHFYEDFLNEYNQQEKIERGVFYTPRPVVSFIVRSVHEMIINEYGLEDGLADTSTWLEAVKKNPGLKKPPYAKLDDPFIQILDPAVGTGTFLVEVIDIIYNTKISKWEKAGKSKDEINNEWDDYVNDHLTPRIFGFELMMAPYSICHVKLGLKLKETGFDLNKLRKRFNIFLTNTLEEPAPLQLALDVKFLAKESDESNKIKQNTPISIIIGNPPYSVSSSNKGEWIKRLISVYKQDLTEKKINIDDDYIKFIRYCEHFLCNIGTGILAMITNNSFIDGVTHRKMRQHLISSFDEIYVLDLHGSVKKREINPDGGKDENIFDIQQGVSINFLINKCDNNASKRVFNSNLYGLRNSKYKYLQNNKISSIGWNEVDFTNPYFFYTIKDFSNKELYEKGISINDLFNISNSGVQTDRDKLFISSNKTSLIKIIKKLLSNKLDRKFIEKYNIKDSSSFKILSRINGKIFNSDFIQKFHYRPYDYRWIYYDPEIISRPAYKAMKHMVKNNISLQITSKNRQLSTNYFFLSKYISDRHLLDTAGDSMQVFPLFNYSNNEQQFSVDRNFEISNNINRNFQKIITEVYSLDFEKAKHNINETISPIDILDYVYSILHSSDYQQKYKDFLKIDFPKIPFVKKKDVFYKMVKFGSKLRELHLLESSLLDQIITDYSTSGDNSVNAVKYRDSKVYINNQQYFDNVSLTAWEFYVGGFQPAQKWLKDRKGRKLSAEDIEHYQKIIVALTETDRIMKEIDKVYPEVEKDLIEFKLDELENKDEKKTEPDKNQKIFDLIEKGEGSTIEFKATLQKSIDNPNIPPTVIENNVIKSIAGFCNTEGGNLLIGVNDNGDIIGIEEDTFQSNDKFKNHLKNILDARVTKSVFSSIKTEFFNIEGKTVCCIECNKSDVPLFVDYEGNSHFYKRNLESTDSLNPQETMEWANKRFK